MSLRHWVPEEKLDQVIYLNMLERHGGGVVGTQTKGTAGGGGSYNAGTDQQNIAGVNKGDGKVIITLRR